MECQLDINLDLDVDGKNEARVCCNKIKTVKKAFNKLTEKSWLAIGAILLIGYLAYFCWCMYYALRHDLMAQEETIRLIKVTIVLAVGLSYMKIRTCFTLNLAECGGRIHSFVLKYKIIFRFIIIICAICGNIAVIVLQVILKDVNHLMSVVGVVVFILIIYITSYNPARVNWYPVFWGLELQFYIGLLILRWEVGSTFFQWCGDRTLEFMKHSEAGSAFVFGDPYYKNHYLAFVVVPIVIFFSTTISVLHYLGVMQFIIGYIGRGLAFALGTSPAESLVAAANIFIGTIVAPLFIRPLIPKLTNSELHAILTTGFATISGDVLAAYVSFGVSAKHLLAASVMAAPAALVISKISYPETKNVTEEEQDAYSMGKSDEKNIIEAAYNGASQSTKMATGIMVNLIAFIALLEFLNMSLTWFGQRAGLEPPEHEYLTFQFICSYVFWPVAYLMGVPSADCRVVGELLGIRLFLNEFVAYVDLSTYINNEKNLTWYKDLASNNSEFTGDYFYRGRDIHYVDFNHTLIGGILQERSTVLSTYALCGFSNVSVMGIMLGALEAMAPARKTDVSKLILRTMLCGNMRQHETKHVHEGRNCQPFSRNY